MTEEQAIAVKKPDAPVEWGTRGEIGALADRLATMLPNAKEMQPNELMMAAQYCRMMDLNPFRGEVYFYKSRGKLVVVDGYKSLVRWAQNKSPYSDRYEPLPFEDGHVAHVRCWILREDREKMLRDYVGLGATFQEAYEMAATFGDGSVAKKDTAKREPPTGWTWEQVARKRALKNALNLSHGAPSPREMAELSWQTGNGVKTIPKDWDGTEELSGHEAERLAEMKAHDREKVQIWESLTPEEQQAKAEDNGRLLYGDEEFEGFDTPPEAPPVDATAPPLWDESLFTANEVDEPLSARKARLLEEVKAATDGYYKAEDHMLNTIRMETDDEWPWTNILDDKGYGYAKDLLLSHAEKQAA